MKYQIEETNEFSSLRKLYFDCGLEGAMEKEFINKKVKHWNCICEGELIGGVTLRIEETYCVLEFLAVKEQYRNQKIGKSILEIIEAYTKNTQIPTIILCAKEPLFYLKQRWSIIEDNYNSMMDHCLKCKNYEKSCFPKMMVKKVV